MCIYIPKRCCRRSMATRSASSCRATWACARTASIIAIIIIIVIMIMIIMITIIIITS